MPAVWEDRNFRTSESKLRSQQNGKSKCLYGISNACMPEESGKWTTHCVERMGLPWTLSHAHSCNQFILPKMGHGLCQHPGMMTSAGSICSICSMRLVSRQNLPRTNFQAGSWSVFTPRPAHVQCRRTQRAPHGKVKPNLRCKYNTWNAAKMFFAHDNHVVFVCAETQLWLYGLLSNLKLSFSHRSLHLGSPERSNPAAS